MDQIVQIGEFTFSLPYSFNELRPVDFQCNSEQIVLQKFLLAQLNSVMSVGIQDLQHWPLTKQMTVSPRLH